MESLKHIITDIYIFTTGAILLYTSLVVFTIFISYKELRSGVYGIIIATTFSEIYLGLHSVINAINGLFNRMEADSFCIADAAITTFFLILWCFMNLSIMMLIYLRKLERSKWGKFVHLTAFPLALLITLLVYVNDGLGLSIFHSCFVDNNTESASVALALGIVMSVCLISLLYNFWYLCFRDKSIDRNIINSYNYYILLTSFSYTVLAVNIGMNNYFHINSKEFNLTSIFVIGLCQVYTGYFRWSIEYVQVVLKSGPSKNKLLNGLFLLTCMYKRPRFKDIRKVVNVKFVRNFNDSENTIYSFIARDY
jgi:hypothetical protein